MEPESSAVFHFTIWPGVAVRRVDELVVELEGRDSTSRPPAASVWNEESSSWERLDVGWGQRSIPDAGAYVSTSGDVLLRLDTDPEWPADVQRLTITVKGQR